MVAPSAVDIAVIGGGISGLGVALEAALNGFEVALFEKGTLASATSANSLRIMHGGIRYLQQMNLPRVMESVRAQAELLADFPDIVRPLPCLMPLASGGLKSALPMKFAGAIYNLIAKYERSSIPAARVVGSSFVREHLPALEPLCTSGAFLWHDALLLSPAALIEAVSSKASACGARLFEHSRVSAVARDGNLFRVSIAKDGSKEVVQAKVVVDASGPWLESLLDRSVPANVPLAAGWCRAFNVILTKQLEPRYAVGLHSPRKRLFFAVPRESETVLGTAYFAHQGDPEMAKINAREIEDFIVDFQATWPQAAVTLNDVKSVEFGVLPMQHVDPYGPVLYGRERILDRQGYVSVMSTKYTTFREQARAVLKSSAKYLR